MAQYQKYGINPLLISIITGQKVEEISLRPTAGMLPGRYGRIVAKNMDKVIERVPQNIYRLRCTSCDKAGDYDLGTVAMDVKQYYEQSSGKTERADMADFVQMSGYFRCKHCNAAGGWEFVGAGKSMLMMGLTTAMIAPAIGLETTVQRFVVGNILIDGDYSPKWGSDAEEYYLKKLSQMPQDAFSWNRLGNAYLKGKRTDLAVTAFERSVAIDNTQLESHYSLGGILYEIGELEAAAVHLRQTLACAHRYRHMPADILRNMLASSLQMLFEINVQTGKKVPVVPSEEEMAAAREPGLDKNASLAIDKMIDLTIYPDQNKTLLAAAELYMGQRREEIPGNKRELYLPLVSEQAMVINRSALRPLARINKQAPQKKKDKKKRRK